MRPTLVLVHSPLVGPATWAGVAGILGARGYQVGVPDLRPTVGAGPPYCSRQVEVIAAAARPASGPVVLVGHSGAGALLGQVARRAGRPVRGYVFVDAGLPVHGRSLMSAMPPELAAELRAMAGPDGWLPPWPKWWEADELAGLLPDREVRERFEADCPPLPLALFDEVHPPAPGWDAIPGAYLLLSEGYEHSATDARARGWPVLERLSDHLAPVTDPVGVADAVADLLGSLG
jgi:pimeloyl-ACP methyl ester carboxylesterase